MLTNFLKILVFSHIKPNIIQFRKKITMIEPEKYENHYNSHESKLTASENLDKSEIDEKSIQISNLRFEEYSPGEIFKHLEYSDQNKKFVP
jgi:hypothetical protein